MNVRRFVVAVTFGVVTTLVAAVPHAQSLGDLAKKTQADRDKAAAERDKAAKGSKNPDDSKDAKDANAPAPKVYTDKDVKAIEGSVPGGVSPAATTSTDTPANASKDAASTATTPDAAKKDEAYWRGRMAPLSAKLQADVEKANQFTARIAEARAKLQPNLFEAELSRLGAELKPLLLELEKDNKAVEALKEEGRRAGAPPEWFR